MIDPRKDLALQQALARTRPSAIPAGFEGWREGLERRASAQGAPFVCLVTKDGGVVGSDTTECTWTYTVKALDDTTILAMAVTPQTPRWHFTEYWYAGETRTAPNAATSRYALATWAGATLVLLVCFGEIAKDGPC